MTHVCEVPSPGSIQLRGHLLGSDGTIHWVGDDVLWRIGPHDARRLALWQTTWARLADAGCTTQPAVDEELAERAFRWERVGKLTYHWEWPVEGWRVTAVMALRALRVLAAQGLTLTDLRPSDIVMAGSRPILVHLGSLAPWSPAAEAASLETLDRHFVRPVKCVIKGHARLTRKLLRGAAHGLSADDETAIGGASAEREQAADRVAWLESVRLRQQTNNSTIWARYETGIDEQHHEDVTVKTVVVESVLARLRPRSVLDIACNAGRYALPAAHAGAIVTGIDGDEWCMNTFFDRAAAAGTLATGVVMDMHDPSPTRGWGSGWSASLTHRLPSDLVMMLAFLHHLVVKMRMSAQDVRDLFESLVQRWLLLEIAPHPFSENLKPIRDLYTVEWVIDALGPRFETRERWCYGQRGRCLVLFERV